EGIAQVLGDTWLRQYIARVRLRWGTVIVYALATATAAALVLIALPDIYVSRATVISDIPEGRGLSGTLAQVAGQLGISGEYLSATAPAQFYSDLMRSRTVLEQLAQTNFNDPRSGALRTLYASILRTVSLKP